MIVVGGGIIGLSCAWRLRSKGHPVTLFDARETGAEASWAGAGMLAPGGEVSGPSPLAAMSIASLKQYPGFVDELTRESGVPVDFRICGAMEILSAGDEPKYARQAELGIRSEKAVWNGRAARFYPDDGVVNPRDVTAALKVACAGAGVKFHEHEAVTGILPAGVRTARGEYAADAVLIATGAWSPQTTPVRGHLIGYPAEAAKLDHILRKGHTYLLRRGGIIAGSSTEYVGFDRTIDESVVAGIHSRAAALMPQLAAVAPIARWNGFRPGIDGDMPLIGRTPGTQIWTAVGHYRNGILLAPETARLIAADF